MERVHEWRGKIKLWLDGGLADWGLFVVVFLVALSSFGLGRLSALEDARPAVSLLQAPSTTGLRQMVLGGLLLGSKTGSAYYYPWCAGAAKIAPQNQRWFASEAEARAAGYAPAKSCQGLQ